MIIRKVAVCIQHFKIVEGEPLHGPKQVILGKIAAENFDKKVGDNMKLYGSAFRVVGIYETGAAFEEGAGVISLAEAQALFSRPRQVTFYELKLKPHTDIEALRRRIERRFPDLAVSQSEAFTSSQAAFQIVRGFAWAIALIAILVGGVGMMNTVLMSVFERTREIGALRALGWRQRRVLELILRESLLLALVSGIAGIMFGMLLGKALSFLPLMGSFLQPAFSPSLLARALALGLGAMAGIYPAWWASRLRPVEALRYE